MYPQMKKPVGMLMIRGLKESVICNYDMGVIHLVSFICNMIRGLKESVTCNYDMRVIHTPGVLYFGYFISCVITPGNTIGGTRPYLNSNYLSMTHQMGL